MNGPRSDTRHRDGGQASVEFLGLLPLVLVVVLVCLQGFISVVAWERVHNAARTGARVATMTGSAVQGQQAARKALPDWLIKKPAVPLCEDGAEPGKERCLPHCAYGERPGKDGCRPADTCVRDGEQESWEQTCVDVAPLAGSDGVAGWVSTEIPLLFPGAPLVFPIEATVEMPT